MAESVRYILRKIKRPSDIRQFVGILFLIVLAVIGRPSWPGLFMTGTLLSIAGIVIRFWAGGYVKKDRELATTGPYAFVRNPLYVGNVLIALGFCILSGRAWSFAALAVLYLWLYIPSIRKEERTLSKLFGDDFVRYKKHVRAMWPRLSPYETGPGGWAASQWVKNGEHIVNAGLLIALAVLISRYFAS